MYGRDFLKLFLGFAVFLPPFDRLLNSRKLFGFSALGASRSSEGISASV
jgi:hypothetical protein